MINDKPATQLALDPTWLPVSNGNDPASEVIQQERDEQVDVERADAEYIARLIDAAELESSADRD